MEQPGSATKEQQNHRCSKSLYNERVRWQHNAVVPRASERLGLA